MEVLSGPFLVTDCLPKRGVRGTPSRLSTVMDQPSWVQLQIMGVSHSLASSVRLESGNTTWFGGSPIMDGTIPMRDSRNKTRLSAVTCGKVWA